MAFLESQKDMLEHSAKKVELLHHYLDAYINIIGYDPYTKFLHCFDLFCGEGVYPNGGEGSPLVFAKKLLAASRRYLETQFSFHYNDIDKAKVESAKAHINSLPGLTSSPLKTFGTNLPFQKIIPLVKAQLAQLRQGKAFIFIDPYGYEDSNPGLISELMVGKKTEVLLFLPVQHMFRFSKRGTPEPLDDFLKGIAFDRELPVNTGMRGYIEYIKEGFRQLLPQCYVDSFTIQKDAKTAYCLFFFTSHIRGAEKMLEAKWTLDKPFGERWSYAESSSTPSLFDEPQINALEQKLLNSLAMGPMTNEQIYEMTLRAGYLPKHSNEILCALQKNRIIIVEQMNTPARAFYLNYEQCAGSNLLKRKSITIKLI